MSKVTTQSDCCDRAEKLSVGIYRDHEDAIMPTCAYDNDVGYDLYALEDVDIRPGTLMEVRTGVHLALPPGVFAQINTRSSFGKQGLMVHHGVIDPGYTGELSLWVMNIVGTVDKNEVIRRDPCSIKKGDKVAQILFHRALTPTLKKIKSLPKTDRGNKGHGSSGK